MEHRVPLKPVPKPRMTQADRWKRRPAVLRYREYCDQLREHLPGYRFPESGSHVTFHLPMPKSWSQKRRDQMDGQPHQQKPDVDNLLKAVLDALETDDAHIWNVQVSKFWTASEGSLVLDSPDPPG